MAKKILIADDEPGVVQILGMRLRANGYRTIPAHDGATAIPLAHQEKPDLIILDIKMADRDGYTVFEDLKTAVNTMSTPLIFFPPFHRNRQSRKQFDSAPMASFQNQLTRTKYLSKSRECLLNLENIRPTSAQNSVLGNRPGGILASSAFPLLCTSSAKVRQIYL